MLKGAALDKQIADAIASGEITREIGDRIKARENSPGRKQMAAIIEGIGKGLQPVLRDLEERLSRLEHRPTLKYMGVWDGRQYNAGEFVTDHGGIWHCNTTTNLRPGKCPEWTLAVKRGARDRT